MKAPEIHCSPEGVLSFKIELDQEGGLFTCIGAIEMLKDKAKEYYMAKALAEARRKAQSGIIKPGVVN